MMCLACAMKRKIKLDTLAMRLTYCKHCNGYHVCGEAKV